MRRGPTSSLPSVVETSFGLATCFTFIGDVFAHHAHTPIITVFIPGTPLKTTHLQKCA